MYYEMTQTYASTKSINWKYKKESIFKLIVKKHKNTFRLTIEVDDELVFNFDILGNFDENSVNCVINVVDSQKVKIINNKNHCWEDYKFENWKQLILTLQEYITNIENDFIFASPLENMIKISKYNDKTQNPMDLNIANEVVNLTNNFFNDIKHASEEVKNMKWCDIVFAINYYKEYKKTMGNESSEDMATRFLCENCDDPAFSAILMVHKIKSSTKDQLKCAHAYIKHNMEFVEDAYRTDAENKDPVISGLISGCICIPRCSEEQNLCKSKQKQEEKKYSDEESVNTNSDNDY